MNWTVSIKSWPIVIWLLLGTAFHSGCGTVVPKSVKSGEPSFDDSTPPQYDQFNSGVIAFTTDSSKRTTGALITAKARQRYNDLVSSYRLQFKERFQKEVNTDDGVIAYDDSYGNHLWKIDSEHLAAFEIMVGWLKDGKATDSMWQILKSKLGT